MLKHFFTVIAACCLLISAHAQYLDRDIEQKVEREVARESLYNSNVANIIGAPLLIPVLYSAAADSRVFVDALWDVVTVHQNGFVQSLLSTLSTQHLATADRIRMQILSSWPKPVTLDQDLAAQLTQKANKNTLDRRALYTYFTHIKSIRGGKTLTSHLKKIYRDELDYLLKSPIVFKPKTKEEIKDLYFNSPALNDYADGRYANGIRLFMFCRHNRNYPCLFLMKNRDNQPVLQSDGKLWSQPSLGLSKLGLPYGQRNGNTPSGILTMDSVMPAADQQESFGKFRRVILDFVPQSEKEAELMKFLPSSAQKADWWKESVVARNAGRDSLRIHGTGGKGSEPGDPYYPLRPTLGCVQQREGKFPRLGEFKDQRLILDKMMESLGLEKIFENETKIIGVLHVIELDDVKKTVTYDTLKQYLDI